MVTIGWILWGLVCALAVGLLFVVVKELRGEVSHPFRSNFRALLLELFSLTGIVASLYITVTWDISKLHFLWLVPASFGAATLLGGLLITVLEPLRFRWYRIIAPKKNPDDRISQQTNHDTDQPTASTTADTAHKKIWKPSYMESSTFGRFFFRAAFVMVISGLIGLFFLGWPFWKTLGFVFVPALLCWYIGFRHDKKNVMRGELYSERFPELYKDEEELENGDETSVDSN